jgi:hypothetical protein
MKTNPFESGRAEVSWAFALINNRLGEIFFVKGKGPKSIFAHCYVSEKEFSRQENKLIKNDIKRNVLTYRNKKYKIKTPIA